MVYKGIGNYLEKNFGITEFWIRDKRIMKTVEGEWLFIK